VLSAKGYVVLCIRTSLQNIYTLSILIQARTQLSQQFACNPYKVNGTLFGHGFTPLKPHWTYYTENKEQKQNAKTPKQEQKARKQQWGATIYGGLISLMSTTIIGDMARMRMLSVEEAHLIRLLCAGLLALQRTLLNNQSRMNF
jgi:lipoprotein NlpI